MRSNGCVYSYDVKIGIFFSSPYEKFFAKRGFNALDKISGKRKRMKLSRDRIK